MGLWHHTFISADSLTHDSFNEGIKVRGANGSKFLRPDAATSKIALGSGLIQLICEDRSYDHIAFSAKARSTAVQEICPCPDPMCEGGKRRKAHQASSPSYEADEGFRYEVARRLAEATFDAKDGASWTSSSLSPHTGRHLDMSGTKRSSFDPFIAWAPSGVSNGSPGMFASPPLSPAHSSGFSGPPSPSSAPSSSPLISQSASPMSSVPNTPPAIETVKDNRVPSPTHVYTISPVPTLTPIEDKDNSSNIITVNDKGTTIVMPGLPTVPGVPGTAAGNGPVIVNGYVLPPVLRPRQFHACKKAVDESKMEKRKLQAENGAQFCRHCGATHTPEWRRGPDGKKSLCNACGLHYSKVVKRETELVVTEGRAPTLAFLLN
eukprot:TRINITY_DN2798_c0_g1_i2.p1 TRINITY_DN2798_c0_g1~~TRINITY_DN2798_c0_g1_i2.p1  ORF type:complete len:378 (+),score=118.47 TRINITY_DN2798_c0_g1_i2:346-1479(+)